jgi:hypothetical protein
MRAAKSPFVDYHLGSALFERWQQTALATTRPVSASASATRLLAERKVMANRLPSSLAGRTGSERHHRSRAKPDRCPAVVPGRGDRRRGRWYLRFNLSYRTGPRSDRVAQGSRPPWPARHDRGARHRWWRTARRLRHPGDVDGVGCPALLQRVVEADDVRLRGGEDLREHGGEVLVGRIVRPEGEHPTGMQVVGETT